MAAIKQTLNVVSYNLHGFNQGKIVIEDLLQSTDIFLLQEHWLTL